MVLSKTEFGYFKLDFMLEFCMIKQDGERSLDEFDQ